MRWLCIFPYTARGMSYKKKGMQYTMQTGKQKKKDDIIHRTICSSVASKGQIEEHCIAYMYVHVFKHTMYVCMYVCMYIYI